MTASIGSTGSGRGVGSSDGSGGVGTGGITILLELIAIHDDENHFNWKGGLASLKRTLLLITRLKNGGSSGQTDPIKYDMKI